MLCGNGSTRRLGSPQPLLNGSCSGRLAPLERRSPEGASASRSVALCSYGGEPPRSNLGALQARAGAVRPSSNRGQGRYANLPRQGERCCGRAGRGPAEVHGPNARPLDVAALSMNLHLGGNECKNFLPRKLLVPCLCGKPKRPETWDTPAVGRISVDLGNERGC
jgi:hypothetical protein